MSYKAIGFDYGGVIFGQSGVVFNEKIASIFNVELSELVKVYFQNNHRVNIGEVTWEEMWKDIAMDLNRADKVDDVVVFIDKWEKERELNLDVIKLIEDLKTSGYKIGLLSNYNSSLYQQLKEQKIDNHFDAIGISSEMGVMKPDVEAFVGFCNMLDVQSNELVFIDDTPKSLETSEEVGYASILFQDFDNLCQELRDLGVIVK